MGRAHGLGIDLGHAPFVELDADVALDPGKGILLADRDQHVVAGDVLVGLSRGLERAPSFGVVFGRNLLEQHAGEAAGLVGEFLRHEIIEDRDALVHRVLLLPGRGLHLLEAGADDDGHLFAAEPARGPAAIHRGVAAAEHDDAAADLVDMAERYAREPVDADMDALCRFLAARNVEVAPARRAGADENRVPILRQQRLEAVDAVVTVKLDAEIEDVTAFLVDDGFGQPEARDLGADHAARLGIAVEHDAAIAERREIARDGERCRAGADERDALAVLAGRLARQAGADVVLVIGGNALEPADRDRLLLDTDAATGGLARPVAGAPEHARKHV